MLHRYQVLFSIPEQFADIRTLLNDADPLLPEDPVRKATIIRAGKRAHELLTGLTDSPPLWLSVQRQVLVEGWSFGDLKGLADAELRAAPLVDVLTELSGGLPSRLVADPKQLVEDACEQFRRVRLRASEAMKERGVKLPDGGVAVYVKNSTLVDEAHERLWWLRGTLRRLLDEAVSQQQDRRPPAAQEPPGQPKGEQHISEPEQARHARQSEWTWERLLRVVAEVVTVVASVATAMVLAPEVWDEVQKYAESLVHIYSEVRSALSREISLLGLVVAIRQVDQLGSPPGDSIAGPEGPPLASPPHQGGPAQTPSTSPAHQDPASGSLATAGQEPAAQVQGDWRRYSVPPPGQSSQPDSPFVPILGGPAQPTALPSFGSGRAEPGQFTGAPLPSSAKPTETPALPSGSMATNRLGMPTPLSGADKEPTESPKKTSPDDPRRSPAEDF
jgi:hypothetical protein